MRDFALHTNQELAAGIRCPFDPLRSPAITAYLSRHRRHPAFSGESVSDCYVHLILGASSRRIAALRGTANVSGGRTLDWSCATHRCAL